MPDNIIDPQLQAAYFFILEHEHALETSDVLKATESYYEVESNLDKTIKYPRMARMHLINSHSLPPLNYS